MSDLVPPKGVAPGAGPGIVARRHRRMARASGERKLLFAGLWRRLERAGGSRISQADRVDRDERPGDWRSDRAGLAGGSGVGIIRARKCGLAAGTVEIRDTPYMEGGWHLPCSSPVRLAGGTGVFRPHLPSERHDSAGARRCAWGKVRLGGAGSSARGARAESYARCIDPLALKMAGGAGIGVVGLLNRRRVTAARRFLTRLWPAARVVGPEAERTGGSGRTWAMALAVGAVIGTAGRRVALGLVIVRRASLSMSRFQVPGSGAR